MTMTRQPLLRLIFLTLLALSLFVPTGYQLWRLNAQKAEFESAAVFRQPERGVDPRDPVRGRYAVLQIAWPAMLDKAAACSKNGLMCALCLRKQSDTETAISVSMENLPDAQPCDAVIDNVFFMESGINDHTPMRVYLDESVADAVDQALRDGKPPFTADIVFTKDKRRVIRQLYMDGQPYIMYLQGR